jgi:outer membrane protein assembly factor BamB
LFALIALVCAGCDWVQFGYGPAHTGSSPDQSISAAQVASGLTVAWRSAEGIATSASPAVASGIVYVSDQQHLFAYDAAGTTGCSGSPRTCSPLWRAVVGGALQSSPAVVNGVVYVGSDSRKLYAFDAAGNTNCGGAPKTCSPLWTATVGASILSSPAVSGGVVYVDASDVLYAYDAAGHISCGGAPKTCTPLWTANGNGGGGSNYSSPAVAGGVVYVTASPNGTINSTLLAYDAAGTTGCSGNPKTCTPLWTAAVPGFILASPVVANGVLYLGNSASATSKPNALAAFDAAGGAAHCAGAAPNRICTPLWTAPVPDGIEATPAVADGSVLVGDENGTLYAFDASGTTNCTGTPKECAPLWHTDAPSSAAIGFASPTVANGVVYFGRENAGGSTAGAGFVAYDAHGVVNCDHDVPKTCTPLFLAGIGQVFGPSVPANGFVYVPGSQLLAFRPSAT